MMDAVCWLGEKSMLSSSSIERRCHGLILCCFSNISSLPFRISSL